MLCNALRGFESPALIFQTITKMHKGVGPLHTKMRHLVVGRFYLPQKTKNYLCCKFRTSEARRTVSIWGSEHLFALLVPQNIRRTKNYLCCKFRTSEARRTCSRPSKGSFEFPGTPNRNRTRTSSTGNCCSIH